MYFATAVNSANNLFIKTSKEFGQDLHNCFLTASSIHASALTAIATLAFISDKFDQEILPINTFSQSHTAPIIEGIELMVTVVRAIILNESLIQGEAEIFSAPSETALEAAETLYNFINAFVESFITLVSKPLETSLEALKEVAKNLGVKNYHCYRNADKLQAAIVMAQS